MPSRRSLLAAILTAAVTRGIARMPAAAGIARQTVDPLTPTDLATLARAVEQAVAGVPAAAIVADSEPGPLLQPPGPVFVALRADGALVTSAWGGGPTALEATVAAVQAAIGRVDATAAHGITAADLCLSHFYEIVVPAGEGERRLTNVYRGVLGVELTYGNETGRYSPTWTLAHNWSFDSVIERFAAARGVPVETILADAEIRVFHGEQVLVRLGPPAEAIPMHRGNQVVPLDAVTEASVRELERLMGAWLVGAVHPDGRMTYKYWPSRDEESTANNTIRQWMATVALNRLAAAHGDAAIVDVAERNIRYNLDAFYREEGELGLIDFDGSVKLGAVALAALAIIEHPRREAFAREEAALRRTVDALWQPGGAFRTFYTPADRNDNQNFYPGEALVLWAALYAEARDPALLARFMASFRHYRAWHLDEANRNPAFVPWHTQANYRVWAITGDPELRDFIFEMNDWLLSLQEWDAAVYPDTMGRFYDATRPQFGMPHASSTGVYLEGLIDAWRLAVAVGDVERAERYRLVIRRGLRSVLQLQFADDIDMYYVARRDLVVGAIRTTVYDNEIRVDNVQHNLLAVLGILDAFAPSDFLA